MVTALGRYFLGPWLSALKVFVLTSALILVSLTSQENPNKYAPQNSESTLFNCYGKREEMEFCIIAKPCT